MIWLSAFRRWLTWHRQIECDDEATNLGPRIDAYAHQEPRAKGLSRLLPDTHGATTAIPDQAFRVAIASNGKASSVMAGPRSKDSGCIDLAPRRPGLAADQPPAGSSRPGPGRSRSGPHPTPARRPGRRRRGAATLSIRWRRRERSGQATLCSAAPNVMSWPAVCGRHAQPTATLWTRSQRRSAMRRP